MLIGCTILVMLPLYVFLTIKIIKHNPQKILATERVELSEQKDIPAFFYVEYGGFKWKAFRHSHDIDKTPFCPTHECQLMFARGLSSFGYLPRKPDYFECPEDHETFEIKEDIEKLKSGARSLASSKIDKEYLAKKG